MPGMDEGAPGRAQDWGGGAGGHLTKGGEQREMSLRPGRSCKMQSFLSRDKKRGFYSKFHEKPPESFTLGNDMIRFLFSKQIPSATCGEEL